MQKLCGFNGQNLKKKILVFDLEDILISGQIAKNIDKKKVFDVLEKLSALEKNVPAFRLFLVSGYSKKEGMKKLAENNLLRFFKPGHVFFPEKGYLNSMAEVDKARYSQRLAKDPLFQDEYFKQVVLEKISKDFQFEKSRMVFIGHDLLTEAFYSQRFSKVDVALVKEALSLRHQKTKNLVKGLIYLNFSWADFKKLLLGKKPAPDYSFLKRFIENYLQREIIGGMQINASALLMKKQQQKPN